MRRKSFGEHPAYSKEKHVEMKRLRDGSRRHETCGGIFDRRIALDG